MMGTALPISSQRSALPASVQIVGMAATCRALLLCSSTWILLSMSRPALD